MVGTQLSCVAAGIRVPMADHPSPPSPPPPPPKIHCYLWSWTLKSRIVSGLKSSTAQSLHPEPAPLFFPVKLYAKPLPPIWSLNNGWSIVKSAQRTPAVDFIISIHIECRAHQNRNNQIKCSQTPQGSRFCSRKYNLLLILYTL